MVINHKAELLKLLVEQGHLTDEDIMPLLKKGALKLLGGKEKEQDLFKPIGYLKRHMATGEAVFEADIDRNNKENYPDKYNQKFKKPFEPSQF